MKYLVVGLGNIGAEYASTRHNIGFMILDYLADKNKFEFQSARHSFYAEHKHRGRQIYFIKPTTYMNLSGKAVRYWLNELDISLENLLVVTDDIALPFGKIRMKPSGSHGGHNGLRNIEELIDSRAFPRLRIGVGDDFPKGRQVDYVLSPFTKAEQKELPLLIDQSSKAILSWIDIGIERAMNFFN